MRRAARWSWAALLAVLPALYGCGDALGAPPAPEATTKLLQASDTTAMLVATWGEVDPPADLWRWRLVRAGVTGETTQREVSVEIERRDTTYTETACVRGVAQRGDEEAQGEEGCASVDVPPRPLDPPGTPQPEVQVDTIMATTRSADSAWVFARWSPGEGVAWYRTYVTDGSTTLAWRNENNWSPRYPWGATGFYVPRRSTDYEATLVLEAYGERGDYYAWPVPQEPLERTAWTWTVPAAGGQG